MPGKRISREMHAQIKILSEEGYSTREIAARLQLAQKTVSRSISNFKTTGNYGYSKPKGRHKSTSKRMDESIILAAKKSPRKSAKAIQAGLPKDVNIPSQRTIRRRLFNANLKSYKPAKKPKLSPKNIADRLTFCKKYQGWTAEQWKDVMFSDETQVSQFYAFCRNIRRPPNKRDCQRYIIPTVKNAAKLMVWGAICAKGRCGLWFMPEGTSINGTVYLDVLKEKLPPFMNITQCTHFQHDGAPCHQTKSVKTWIAKQVFQILGPWPGNSPDLNPIENCWVILKRKVAERNPTSLSDLRETIKQVWITEITPDYCEKLCISMPDRIQAVLEKKGFHTKY